MTKKILFAKIKNIHARRFAIVVLAPCFIVILTIAFVLQTLNNSLTEAFLTICEAVCESAIDYASAVRSILKNSVKLMSSNDHSQSS